MAWHTQLDDPIEAAVAEALAPATVDVGNDTVADVGNVYRQGDRDAGPDGDIRAAQTALTRLGTDVGEVDGVYGRNTSNAVQDAQEMFGLPRTGVLDQDTQDALNNLTDDQISFFTSETEAIAEQVESPTEPDTPAADGATGLTSWSGRNFADTFLRRHEGTQAHSSLEGGRDTAAFGVKFSRGLNRGDYSSDLDFAAAVAQEHYNDVATAFSSQGRELASLPVSVQNALVDLNYNAGTIGSTAQKDSPEGMLRNTLEFVGVTTNDGVKGSLIALARRRAENWNATANDIGVSRIASVEQVPTSNGGTTFRYLAADGNVLHTVNTSRTPIRFTSGTSYEVLTDTRRVEIN